MMKKMNASNRVELFGCLNEALAKREAQDWCNRIYVEEMVDPKSDDIVVTQCGEAIVVNYLGDFAIFMWDSECPNETGYGE